jgi:hypothetical protein
MTYSEGLEVVHGQVVAEEVKESILEHAAVTVTVGLGQYAILCGAKR